MLHHIETDRITIEMAVAPIALALAAHPTLDAYDLSSLRYIMWCATPVTQSVAEAVTAQDRRELGDRLRRERIAGDRVQLTIEGARLDTVGRPVPGVDVRSSRWRHGATAGARRGR